MGSLFYEHGVRGENAHHGPGKEFGKNKAEHHHQTGPAGGFEVHLPHAAVLPGAVVVPRNGLHALVEAHHNHHEEEGDAVHDAIRADGQVSAPLHQLLVDEQHHNTAGEVHQERPHANGQGILGYLPVHPEHLERTGQVQETVRIQEIPKRIAQRHALAQDGGQRRALDAHVQRKDEDGVQNGIGGNCKQGEPHGQLGIAGRADNGVETKIQVRDGIAKGNDGHVVTGKGKGGVRGSEKAEDGVHPQQHHGGKDDARYEVEADVVAEHLAGHLVVFLAQQDRNHGGGSYAHQRTERGGNVHQGEGDGESCDAQRAYIGNMADVYAVHHIIQRRRGHGNDAGDRVLAYKRVDGLGAQFCGDGSGAHSFTISTSNMSGE